METSEIFLIIGAIVAILGGIAANIPARSTSNLSPSIGSSMISSSQ